MVAVDGVSLDIAPGEFVTLLGPSGSGKTTTLMMLAGFEIPTAGEIYVDEDPIASVPPYRRNIGMVFQNYALFPHMTVGENIAFPLQMRKMSRAEITRQTTAVLALVGLPGYEGRYPRQLSGGQQQRVAVARALVFNPRVLLMDEPLGALDKQLREHLQLEIKALHDQLGVTIIYVTHDQEEALVMSDRIAVMNDGRIEQCGLPTELYDEPSTRFVATFIGESNFIDGVVDRLDGTAACIEAPGLGELRAPAPRGPRGRSAGGAHGAAGEDRRRRSGLAGHERRHRHGRRRRLRRRDATLRRACRAGSGSCSRRRTAAACRASLAATRFVSAGTSPIAASSDRLSSNARVIRDEPDGHTDERDGERTPRGADRALRAPAASGAGALSPAPRAGGRLSDPFYGYPVAAMLTARSASRPGAGRTSSR